MINTHIVGLPQPQQQQSQPQQFQQQAHGIIDAKPQSHQQFTVRVTMSNMSALANQLSSPPAIMSSSTINPQTYNFAQLKPMTQQQPQQIIITNNSVGNAANRIITQANIRRESLPVPSPGSDSNASNASSSNKLTNDHTSTYTIGHNFNTFIATSPSASILSDNGVALGGSHNNQNATTLIDRLNNTNNSIISQQSMNSPLGSVASPQSLPLPSPTTTLIQQPVTSQTVTQQQNHHQTTTLNLQSINLSSLQGAMATFPGLQNVQVSYL